MKKVISILLVLVGCVMIIFGFVNIFYKDDSKEVVKDEVIETDSKCINAFLNNDNVLKTVTIDDVSIEFKFLNCDLKEKRENGKYYLFSPAKGYLIESYLSNYSPASTALEIFDSYREMDKYLDTDITMKSGSTDDGVLYRTISVVPAKEINYKKNFYHEYIIVYMIEDGKTIVLKAQSEIEEDPTLLFETIFNSFKIIKY